MSRKHAGPIVASSFVAGLLLTAVIFVPRANDPIPEPYFGLEEPDEATGTQAVAPDTSAKTPGSSRSARPGLRNMAGAGSLAAVPARAGESSSQAGGPRPAAR